MNLSTSFVGVREKMKEKLATQILNKLTCSASKCLYFEERKDKLMTNKDIKPTYFAQSFCILNNKIPKIHFIVIHFAFNQRRNKLNPIIRFARII